MSFIESIATGRAFAGRDDPAVVIVYSVGLIAPAEFTAIRRVRAMEFRWVLVACLVLLVFGTLKGVVVAIIVSLFPDAQGVAEQLDALVAQQEPRVVALDMSRVPDIEYSALQMLIEGERRAPARGFELWLVGLNPGVLEVVRSAGLAERLGRERIMRY